MSPSTCKFIVECTKSYAKTDWIVATPRLDHDENITWLPIHKIIHLQAGTQVPYNAWHRWNPGVGDSEFDITPDLVLAWLVADNYIGAMFHCNNNCGINAIYTDSAYDL